jgi:putative NIF3 family GTP cyclohydrolase 1 type 2
MTHLSRRQFVALASLGATAAPFALNQRTAHAAALTAQEIVDRIKKNLGVDWKADTVDTFKAGDPSMAVTGIVTTSMATLVVLQQAVKAGANFVITAQPTFYSKADSKSPLIGRGGLAGRSTAGARVGRGAAGGGAAGAGANQAAAPPMLPPAPVPPLPPDPVYAGKNDFIARNNLVIFRLSDHWKMRKPDPIGQGLGVAFGWAKYQVGADTLRYDLPSMTLGALASHVKKSLSIRGGLRVIGDPQLMVQHIGLLPGTTPIQASLQLLPTVDAIIAGEVREWESATYAQDVVYTGGKKGFMTVGRVVDEEPGMGICANWLKTIVSEVPIQHISAGDPYWRPL